MDGPFPAKKKPSTPRAAAGRADPVGPCPHRVRPGVRVRNQRDILRPRLRAAEARCAFEQGRFIKHSHLWFAAGATIGFLAMLIRLLPWPTAWPDLVIGRSSLAFASSCFANGFAVTLVGCRLSAIGLSLSALHWSLGFGHWSFGFPPSSFGLHRSPVAPRSTLFRLVPSCSVLFRLVPSCSACSGVRCRGRESLSY